MNNKVLILIKMVHDHHSHVQEISTLVDILNENNDKYKDEIVVAKTTINSYYQYGLYGFRQFQHPENHIDEFFGDTINDIKERPLVTAPNDHELFYPQRS